MKIAKKKLFFLAISYNDYRGDTMKLLYKDQLRKIKLNKFNFISLSLLVIIISFTFTAVKSSVMRLEDNYDDYLIEQNLEDFYFSMGKVDVNYLGGTATYNLCTELDLELECALALANPENNIGINNLNVLINEKIDERPELYEEIIDNLVDKFSETNDFIVEKKRMANVIDDEFIYKFMSLSEVIDIPYLVDGRLPIEDFEIAIYPEFAVANNLEIDDTFIIENQEYLIKGFFYSPEFILPIFSMNTISFDSTLQTLVLCNDNTMNSLDQFIFTKYLVIGDISEIFSDFDYDSLLNLDRSLLGKNMQIVSILMPSDINFRITSLKTEVDNANAFTNIFLSLFLVFVAILLIVFMKRYIEKNKDDIYTLHALGYTNNEITKSLLVFPIIVGLTTIIGYLLGLLGSNLLFNMYSARYLFPKADFVLYFDIFALATIIPFLFILIMNYFFIYRSVSFKKKNQNKKSLRVFRFTPLKTIITTFILFMTINIMIIFGLSGNSMFTSFIDKTKLGNNYHQMINLEYFTDEIIDEDYQPYTKVGGTITFVNDEELSLPFNTTIYGIEPRNNLKLLMNNEVSNNLLLTEGAIISEYLSASGNLKKGDIITLKIGGEEISIEIMGISNELIENNVFVSKELINSMYGLDNSYYKGLYVTDDLYDNDYITSKLDYQNSLDEFSSLLNISSIIMTYLVFLSSILSLFIFGLVLTSYFNDNRTNIAILKSIGYNNKEINLKYLLNIYIVLLITFVISIPVTKALLDMLLKMLMESIGFKLTIDIKILNVFIGFIILNTIFFVTTYLSNKYYDKISIAEIMKKNIK